MKKLRMEGLSQFEVEVCLTGISAPWDRDRIVEVRVKVSSHLTLEKA